MAEPGKENGAPVIAAADSETPVRSLVSEALLIAAVPAFGYAVAFTYEAGYLDEFGLPGWLIELDLSKVFLASAGMLVLLWAVNLLVMMVPLQAFRILHWVRALVMPALSSYLAWKAVDSALTSDHRAWWILAVFMGLVAISSCYLWIVEPIRSRPGPLSWTARLEEEWHREATERPETLFSVGIKSLITRGYGILLPVGFGFLFLVQLAYWAGKREADHQESFLVGWEDSSMVALREYGDHLVVGILGSRSSEGASLVGYMLTPVAGEPPMRWKKRKVGKLRPEPEVKWGEGPSVRWN